MLAIQNKSDLASEDFQKCAVVLIRQIAEAEKRISKKVDLGDEFQDVAELIVELMGSATLDYARERLSKSKAIEILVSLSQIVGDVFFAEHAMSDGDIDSFKMNIELMRKRIVL